MSVVLLTALRQVSPLSLNVMWRIPDPASTTSRPPAVSNMIPRGFLSPLTISWAVYPAPTTGWSYDDVKTDGHPP